jgi:hypothetical protein
VEIAGRLGDVLHAGLPASTSRRSFAAIVAAILIGLTGGDARGSPPDAGVLVPGTSLGGVRLGWTLAHVEALWGRAYGRCRSCRRETLYFNRYAFRPEGAGVELDRGRVTAVFTLWAPAAWRTAEGLRIGEPSTRVEATYGPTPRARCSGYRALTIDAAAAQTVVYVVGGEVWGFGLLRRGAPVCR